MTMAAQGVEATPAEPAPGTADKTAALPKLSAQEYRVYNSMADHMEYFHEHFRATWKQLYGACAAGRRPAGLSVAGFVRAGEDFCSRLTLHHTIEEQHIFPVLARRMPAFRQELDLLTHHRLIHEGLERLEAYLAACRAGERELRLDEVKVLMDGFGEVLWTHLDAEVKELGAENMRKFWSVEEMRRMPM